MNSDEATLEKDRCELLKDATCYLEKNILEAAADKNDYHHYNSV